MNRHILPLNTDAAWSKTEVGGKGASLLWLAGHGFKTMPGFIVTAASFLDFIRSSGIDLHQQNGDPGQVQEELRGTAIPKAVEESIRTAYQQLGGHVAVRSSMVNEDGSESSYAGQLDSLLNVEGAETVVQAVRSCWVSMVNLRLLAYLRGRNSEFEPSMAVIVQGMAEAKAAGVAFSADPISGEEYVIIEATAGLGDVVAGGTVNPDRWVVDPDDAILEAIQHSPETAALPDAQVVELAGILRRVASLAGSPQDVEWAWDGAGFVLLQARPITTLTDRDTYSSKFVSEMVPGLIKPLVWSTTTSAIAYNVFAHVFDELLGRGRVDVSKLMRRIHSRLYANVTLLGKACEQLGLPANFFETITRGERPTNVRKSFLSFANLPEKLRLVRFVFRNSRAAPRISSFVARRQSELEPYRHADWDSKTVDELLASIERIREFHGEVQWHIFITALNMSVRNRMLGRMVQRAAPGINAADLLSGTAPSQALAANHALQDMAARARDLDEPTRQLLATGDDASIRKALSLNGIGNQLAASMDEFQTRYGFLSANGTDFSLPAWSENPGLIWHMVGRLLRQPPPSSADASARQRAVLGQVRSKLSPLGRLRFENLLAATVTYVDLRERVSQLISVDAHLMRRIYLALADRLTALDRLKHRDNIFFLSHEEAVGLARGEITAEAADRLLAARQVEMERDAEIDPPEILRGGNAFARTRMPVPDDSSILTGISGSAGIIRGRARIVHDPSLAPQDLSREDILVVPFTDVGWTPLLAGIGGIVAETGGQLSHTAIVAREYGLPAVVSVKHATQLLREGQVIVVDGGLGCVYLKQEAVI